MVSEMSEIKWDGSVGETADGYYVLPDLQYGWRVGIDGRIAGFATHRGALVDVIERDRALTILIEGEAVVVDADAPLTLDEYQHGTRRTVDATHPSGALTTLALGLAGECGEVVDLIKKLEWHGHTVSGKDIREELGDALFYLAAIADRFGLPLSTVARENDRKLRKRYPDGFSVEASRARADVADDCDDAAQGEDI